MQTSYTRKDAVLVGVMQEVAFSILIVIFN